jgi:CBS domain containing-hemolysin-like protein
MAFWDCLIILLLILLNGFFAMAELAVVSSRPARLKQMAQAGRRGAAAALRLAEQPGRFLSTVQIGITLIGILRRRVERRYAGGITGSLAGRHMPYYPCPERQPRAGTGGRGDHLSVADYWRAGSQASGLA